MARLIGRTVGELKNTITASELVQWDILLTLEAEESKRQRRLAEKGIGR